jgi:hypothetical protein
MELDINPGWVHFNIFGPPAAGQPPTTPSVVYLLPDMGGPLHRYVDSTQNGQNGHDFVALFRRS